MHACIQTDIQTYRHTDIHTYVHAYIQTDRQTYRHTDAHAYTKLGELMLNVATVSVHFFNSKKPKN